MRASPPTARASPIARRSTRSSAAALERVTRAEAMRRLMAAGIACGALNELDDLIAHPQRRQVSRGHAARRGGADGARRSDRRRRPARSRPRARARKPRRRHQARIWGMSQHGDVGFNQRRVAINANEVHLDSSASKAVMPALAAGIHAVQRLPFRNVLPRRRGDGRDKPHRRELKASPSGAFDSRTSGSVLVGLVPAVHAAPLQQSHKTYNCARCPRTLSLWNCVPLSRRGCPGQARA